MRRLTGKIKDRLLNDEDITVWFQYHDSIPAILSETGISYYR